MRVVHSETPRRLTDAPLAVPLWAARCIRPNQGETPPLPSYRARIARPITGGCLLASVGNAWSDAKGGHASLKALPDQLRPSPVPSDGRPCGALQAYREGTRAGRPTSKPLSPAQGPGASRSRAVGGVACDLCRRSPAMCYSAQVVADRRPLAGAANVPTLSPLRVFFSESVSVSDGWLTLRARPEAGVATPLSWDELGRVKSGSAFTIQNALNRLKRLKAAPWEELDDVRQTLPV